MSDLSVRMRNYEQKFKLPENLPVIVRIDGRAFHTLLRNMQKPFDHGFIQLMDEVGLVLCNEVQNCRMAYIQSDEISLLLFQNRDAQPWFSNEIQKITSITSSIASSVYTRSHKPARIEETFVAFDSRTFVLPPDEVTNYFIWRQLDWERNSIQMSARAKYSHKELKNKNTTDMIDLLLRRDVDWNELPTYLKRGRAIIKVKGTREVDGREFYRTQWTIDNNIPKFTEDRDYIESKMEPEFAVVKTC